ncbi:hypothetical protein KIW84_014143 [Lathyrus oleraceus]|uniref:Uncharacterized protein n=1 Tax=Pisum sativum TaxID=3888 RepID=A0A9D5BLW4_PEA|nr:hypothetical protein KIW84_014143 [Pisum sativum]
MSPRSEEKGKGKACRTRFIVEEVLDSYMFIPMPLSSQVPRPPMHLTPLLVHHTSPPMHSTSSIFGSFTGLLSTPYFSSLPPISVIGFISPPEYTPIMHPNTPHPTYFPMPSILVPSHQAVSSITKVIKEKYNKFWPTYGALSNKEKEDGFKLFQEEYDRRLAITISKHPELLSSPLGYPVDSCLGFRTWYDVAQLVGRGKMKECMVLEAHTEPALEAATRNAEMEEMRRIQTEMEKELRRKTTEYEKAMRVCK